MVKKLQKGPHYAGTLWLSTLKYQHILYLLSCMEIFGKFWHCQPLKVCLPFFKVWPLKKQEKDDLMPNLNFFLLNLTLLSTFSCKTRHVQDKISGPAILKINYKKFSNRIVNSFYKVLKNVTIFIFSYFLASHLSHSFFVFTCCIKSYLKRLE